MLLNLFYLSCFYSRYYYFTPYKIALNIKHNNRIKI